VTSERFAASSEPADRQRAIDAPVPSGYYGLMGLSTTASGPEIHRAYRTLSRQYHPDTTLLPVPIATRKFQQLNEAYATLSHPDRRAAYDQTLTTSPIRPPTQTSSVDLPFDAVDRPLSAGELFALMILGLTFLACLLLALTLGWAQGQAWWQTQAPTAAAPTAAARFQAVPSPLNRSPSSPERRPTAALRSALTQRSPQIPPPAQAHPL
jgi:DnaJ-domain-containing protein 1